MIIARNRFLARCDDWDLEWKLTISRGQIQELMQVLYGFSLADLNVPALVELIGQYADIRDADGLAQAIHRHFKNSCKKD